MPSKKQTKDEDDGMLPGMSAFIQTVDEEWFFEGRKNERFFDSANLPDAPGRQNSVVETHAIYLLFPDRETMKRGMAALTQNRRKALAGKTKIVSINAIAQLPDDEYTLLEIWEMLLLGLVPEEKEQSDEAQEPI